MSTAKAKSHPPEAWSQWPFTEVKAWSSSGLEHCSGKVRLYAYVNSDM
jgi:hypothetical protein